MVLQGRFRILVREWRRTRQALAPLKTSNVWQLTEYRGTGEGYFPFVDGFFRRYEPETLGEGLHASGEYEFVADDDTMYIFKDALGNQDRDVYEELKQAEK